MPNTEQEILRKLQNIEEISNKIHLQLVSLEQRFTFFEEKLEKKIQETVHQRLEELVSTAATEAFNRQTEK